MTKAEANILKSNLDQISSYIISITTLQIDAVKNDIDNLIEKEQPMSTDKFKKLPLAQLQDIIAFARTLNEASDELLNLINRTHPELKQAIWLINQTHKRIHEILTCFGENI